MRLSTSQIDDIKQVAKATFGSEVGVWLFGSRLDDAQKGGDVDLYVEAGPHRLMDELRCKIALQELLDTPVDLIVRKPFDASPIANIAKNQGVRL